MQSGSLNGEFEILMHEYTQIVFLFFFLGGGEPCMV